MSSCTLQFEDCFNHDIHISVQKLFCICCLNTDVPLISLMSCTHSEYLDSFSKPDLKPDSQVVCHYCHGNLLKIQLFKQQVQNSFKMLSETTLNTENKALISKFEIHKAVNIDIPEIHEPESNKEEQQRTIKKDIEKSLNQKLDNRQTALEIIKCNSNLSFLSAFINTNSFLELTSFLSINLLNSIQDNSKHDEVPSKKIKFELEDPIQPNFNTFQPNNHIILDTNNMQHDSNELQPQIKNNLKPITLQTDSDVHLKSNEIQRDKPQSENSFNIQEPNDIPSNSNDLQSNLNELQPYSDKLQLESDTFKANSDEIHEDSNTIQANSNKLQPDSNQNLKSILNIPKAHRNKLNLVRLTEDELSRERALQSLSKHYSECDHRCENCIIAFKFQDNYNYHMRMKHNTDLGSFVCKICTQRFTTDKDCETHSLRHYYRYVCVNCEKSFQICDEAIRHYQIKHVHKKIKINNKRKI